MDLNLEGKRALITGSSSGVGRAIAARLAIAGCMVLVHGRHEQSCEEVAADIRAQGGTSAIVVGDLTDPAAIAEVGERALEHGVDILVNNAGPFSEHSWDRVSPSDWVQSYQGNVNGAFLWLGVARVLARGLRGCSLSVITRDLLTVHLGSQCPPPSRWRGALWRGSARRSSLGGPLRSCFGCRRGRR